VYRRDDILHYVKALTHKNVKALAFKTDKAQQSALFVTYFS